MNWIRLRAAAVAVLTAATLAALPLQAFAEDGSHGRDMHCAHVQAMAKDFPALVNSVPGLARQLIMCQGVSAQAFGQSVNFSDLHGFSWAQSDIGFLARMGILRGIGHDRFAPENTLTRAQFAALLQRVFVLPQPTTPTSFVDVPSSSWAYSAIEAAAPYMSEFQLPAGEAFEPDLPVVRIEVAASIGKIEVAENIATLPSAATAASVWAGFSDGNLVPAGLRQYAAVAVETGIMKGFPDGSFGVEQQLNRAQAAVLLARVLQGTETMTGGSTTTTGGTLSGTIESVSSSSLLLQVNGTNVTLPLASSVTVTLNGTSSAIGDLATGEAATVTLNSNGQVTAITATGQATTTTYTGTIDSVSSSTLVMTVNGTLKVWTVASGATVTLNGSSSALGDLAAGDVATVTLNSSNEVTAIAATRASTLQGTISSVSSTDIVLTVNNSNVTLPLASSVTVTLNGTSSALGNLASGDTATVTLNASGQVTDIAATRASTLQGTISSVSSTNIVLTVNSSNLTLPLASSVTVTIGGTAGTMADVTAGETATVTLNSSGQVTAIAVTQPAVTSTVSGYLTGESSSTVTVAVYQSSGTTLNTYNLAPGASVTLGGSGSAMTSLPIGDAVGVGLDAQGTAATVAATTPASPVTVTTGMLVGQSSTTVSLYVNGSVTSLALGSAPIGVSSAGSLISVSSIPMDSTVTVDIQAMGGSALVIEH